jgi:hypothetical protein
MQQQQHQQQQQQQKHVRTLSRERIFLLFFGKNKISYF